MAAALRNVTPCPLNPNHLADGHHLNLLITWAMDFDQLIETMTTTQTETMPRYGGSFNQTLSALPRRVLECKGIDISKVDLYATALDFKNQIKRHGWNATALVVRWHNDTLYLEAHGFGEYENAAWLVRSLFSEPTSFPIESYIVS